MPNKVVFACGYLIYYFCYFAFFVGLINTFVPFAIIVEAKKSKEAQRFDNHEIGIWLYFDYICLYQVINDYLNRFDFIFNLSFVVCLLKNIKFKLNNVHYSTLANMLLPLKAWLMISLCIKLFTSYVPIRTRKLSFV